MERLDLTIDQGTDFSLKLDVADEYGSPFDFSSYTITGQIRRRYNSNTSYDFTVQALDDGVLQLSMSHWITKDIVGEHYIYDVIMESNDDVFRLVGGEVSVRPRVNHFLENLVATADSTLITADSTQYTADAA